MSGDPAMAEYIPSAPVNNEARKRNGNLPGMGGVFNYVNMHVYHYAGNNPVKYVDPDGRDSVWEIDENAKTIEITIPVKFADGTTTEQKELFYDSMKKWEGTYNVNIGLARGNLIDTTSSDSYKIKVNIVEVIDNDKYRGANVNNITFSPLQRDDNAGRISNVVDSKDMTLYVEYHLGKVITHETGHILGLSDRYFEKKDSNGNRNTPPHYGWEWNIMGNTYGGGIDGRNFDEGLLRSSNRVNFR